MQSFQDKNILITGGAGYIATSIIHLFKDVNCKILRYDRSDAFFPPIEGNFHLKDIKGDIRDRDVWKDLLQEVDIVFHLAAQTSIYFADKNPFVDLEINVLPMMNLLEYCREKGWKPVVIFSGTVTEAGLTERLPVNESHPDNPITIYDLNKLMAENYLKHYSMKNYVKGCTLRLANVYGPGPQSSSADRGILNKMIRNAINGEPLTLYGKGDYIRDYIYVEDVAMAFIKAAENVDNLNSGHFVIGSGTGCTLVDAFNLVIERIAVKIDKHVKLLYVDPPHDLDLIETRHFVADTTNFHSITGWKPNYTLICGIDRTIDSFYNYRNE